MESSNQIIEGRELTEKEFIIYTLDSLQDNSESFITSDIEDSEIWINDVRGIKMIKKILEKVPEKDFIEAYKKVISEEKME